MNSQNRHRLSKLALSLAIALATVPAFAQNTTSALGGRITGSDGKPASGAEVTIVHIESGSTSKVITDAEGRYIARGLRVGGPFTITITKDGKTEKRENVFLTLAETASLDVKLNAAQVLEKIEVTAAASSGKFSSTAMGATTDISRADLDRYASIQRNLQDYARNDPRLSQTDKERGEISVGGQNSRFNKITIDSSSISDTFGLEANNLPTLKQPISIDAIQSVQVNVSNYDVTQKGYTGANINAVTKSGTNDFKGSVYYIFRDDKLVGERYDRRTDTYSDILPFEESTAGFTLGGPIIKDKLFFFVNYEELKSTRNPLAQGPLGSSAPNIGITQSAIAGAQSIAMSRYGIDIGQFSLDGQDLEVKDALVKLDWNISSTQRASLRYTNTKQSEPRFNNINTGNTPSLALTSHRFTDEKKIDTVVGQLFSDWSSNFSTEAKLSYRKYESIPQSQSNLPQIVLNFTGALPPGTPSNISNTRNLFFGTENSRHFNVLETKSLDGYLGANWVLNDHDLKFGGDYSQIDIFNAFLQNTKGNYTFSCQNSTATYTYTFGAINCGTATAAQIEQAILENFSRGRPSSYTAQIAQPGRTLSDGAADWSLKNYGTFFQDTWAVNKNLTLTYGLRMDYTKVGDKPLRNAAASAPLVQGSFNPATNAVVAQSGGFGLDNTQTIDGEKLFQPRVGFNYTFDSERPMQIRGGGGLFQGEAANVWLSNPFSNTGVATTVVSCSGTGGTRCPDAGNFFSPNPNTQPTTFTGAAPPAPILDFVRPGVAQPSVWKANLAFEHELPWWGLVAGVEYLYTKTKSGIYYQHLNLGAPTRFGRDGRPLYYNNQGFNPACFRADGSTIAGGVCAGFSTKALQNRNFGNVLAVTETDKGGGNLATVSLTYPLTKNWGWSLAYTYTDAKEVNPLTSSVGNSNFNSRAIFDPNEDVAANSAYLVKDRINGNLSWRYNFFKNYKTQIGVFYEGRRGKPYSWTFNNDANGDGVSGNDLLYVPSAPGSGEVVFLGDTATNRTNEDRFWAVVNQDEALTAARGSAVARNSAFAPWSNSLDVRISQELPGFFKGNKATVALDILNFTNLLNKKWGRIDEIGFQGGGASARSFVNYVGLDASGRYIYSVVNTEDFVTRNVRNESQWQMQFTLRYEF